MTTERELLDLLGDGKTTRKIFAERYSLGMFRFQDTPNIDYAVVNAAIVEHWSEHALRFIKREAVDCLERNPRFNCATGSWLD